MGAEADAMSPRIHPLSFAALYTGTDDEPAGRMLDAVETWVCSVLESLSGGSWAIEEIGALREAHVRARLEVVEAAREWRADAVPQGRGKRAEHLLEGSRRWCRRAELTRREDDVATAERLAVAAASEAGSDAQLSVRALQCFALALRAGALADMSLVTLHRAVLAAGQSTQLATQVASASETPAALHAVVEAMAGMARCAVRVAELTQSERTVEHAARWVATLEALCRDVPGAAALDGEWGVDAGVLVALLQSRLDETRRRRLDGASERHVLLAALAAARRAQEAALVSQDAFGVAEAALLIARQTSDGLRLAYPGFDAEEMGVAAKTALANSAPLSNGSLEALGLLAELMYASAGGDSQDGGMLFAAALRSMCCELIAGHDPATALAMAERWAFDTERTAGSRDALPAYEAALGARRQLIEAHALDGHRLTWIMHTRHVQGLATAAFAAAGEGGRAVAVADFGRSVLVQPLLLAPTDELRALRATGGDDLADEYLAARDEERAAATRARVIDRPDPDVDGDAMADLLAGVGSATARRRAAERAIRDVPGFDAFPAPPAYEDLRAAAADAPLAYVVPGLDAGSLLVLPDGAAHEPVRIPLPRLTSEAAHEAGLAYQSAYRRWRPDADGLAGWPEELHRLGAWMWDAIMGPLLEVTAGAPFVRLVPLDTLMFLPLHVAWRREARTRTYALDHAAFGYVPSAALLLHAQRRPVTDRWRALLVEGPDLDPVMASGELRAAADRFAPACTRLPGRAATREAVESALRSHNLVHISAHGRLREDRPLDSAIELAGGQQLTVNDLRRLGLPQVEVAVLSSCESAMAGGLTLDESLSFPGMLYGVSARAVIAARWAVDQDATSRLFDRFYRRWDLSHDVSALAGALREAQLEIRDEGLDHPLWWGAFSVTG